MKLVKFVSLVVGLIAVASVASAAPFAVTGKFTAAAVNKCVFVLNGGTAVEVNPVVEGTQGQCRYDVASSVNGNNVLSVSYKNIWGSSSVVPFSYTKTLPPNPSDITLSEN
jgi:hypothetical protein